MITNRTDIKELHFINAVRAIDAHPDYYLCNNLDELRGIVSICIYYEDIPCGDLRWNGEINLNDEHKKRLTDFLQTLSF